MKKKENIEGKKKKPKKEEIVERTKKKNFLKRTKVGQPITHALVSTLFEAH